MSLGRRPAPEQSLSGFHVPLLMALWFLSLPCSDTMVLSDHIQVSSIVHVFATYNTSVYMFVFLSLFLLTLGSVPGSRNSSVPAFVN